MLLFPAIDLVGGKAVRLYKGDYAQMTVYNDDPTAVARDFVAAGATAAHLVDLEGARDGGTPNFETVCAIKAASGLFCEIGGGIRTMDVVDRYLDAGIDRVILGTAAVTDPAFVQAAVEKHGRRIAVGIDVKDGFVAIKGWTEQSAYTLQEFAARMESMGVATLICTDVSKDGAMQGTNLAMYRELARTVRVDITASGGVSTLDDVERLAAMGLYGAIIGKAYYTGAIDLREALRACEAEAPAISIDDLRFDDRGLIPAIVQDSETGRVLTLAYMNRESLRVTLERGLTCFWSRSRQELWLKGETSGNYQHVLSITADCDADALLVKVRPDGPACHLGTTSCFEHPLWQASE